MQFVIISIFSLCLWAAIWSIPEVQQQQIQMKRNRLQKCQNKLPESKTMAIRLFFGFEKKSITDNSSSDKPLTIIA